MVVRLPDIFTAPIYPQTNIIPGHGYESSRVNFLEEPRLSIMKIFVAPFFFAIGKNRWADNSSAYGCVIGIL